MPATSEVNYSKSTTTLKSPPAAGENINLFLRPGDELSLGVDLSKAKLQIVGGDVVATLPNGGQITFVSLGMMVFETNAPVVKLPNGMVMQVEQILNKIQDIGQAPKDSVLVSGPVSLQSEQQNTAKDEHTKKEESPVNDYNAYYVDPQPFIKPLDNTNTKENSGKYLHEAVTEYTSNNPAVSDSSEKNKFMDEQSKSKDNVADVSAALSFDLGFYQIKSSDAVAGGITTVLGGTGSALGNVSKSAAAQFQPETLDYRSDAYPTVITADNPSLVNDTYLTKLVRLSVSQPIGFAIKNITVLGLTDAFQILNSDFTSANTTGGGWSLASGTGFTSTATDGGEVIEFYIRYEPNAANMTLNYDYLMKVNLTSQFDMANVPVAKQGEVVVPELVTLTNYKDVGVIVKTVATEADYTYTGHYPTGFVVDTTPNENIIYTSKYDSTVYGGLSNDTIYGNIGNDTLSGDKGNDTISGGSGANVISGGDGIDTVSYDFVVKNYSDTFLSAHSGLSNDPHPQGVIVNLQTGFASGQTIEDSAPNDEYNGEALVNINDTLTSVENVIGSKFDDTIIGSNTVANMLHGGEGNDTLDGGSSGGNYLYGEAGNDWLIGSTRDAKIDGGDGVDTIDFSNNAVGIEITLNNSSNGSIKDIGASAATTVILNVENVAGTQYKDIISGDNSNNLLIGGYNHLATSVTANDDTISGGAGADTIVGDMMVDALIATTMYGGNDVLSGGSENDTIYGDSAPILSTSTLVVEADQSREYIVDGGSTLATIVGGNDTLKGGTGDDLIDGGSGYDTVDFSSSSARVIVNLGLAGNVGSATGEGTDRLLNIENIIGSSYGDTLAGNELANTLNGGSGGSDWVDYGYAGSGVSVDLSTGLATAGGSDIDTLLSIENVLGSSHDDTITDKSGTANTLLGLNGNDIFFSHNNNTGGTDTFDGGNGIDTIDYSLSSGNLHVTLGGSTNIDTLINIENIVGATGNDTLVGDANANILKGMAGADTLMGGAGADTLDGGLGQDMADYSTSNSITVTLANGTVVDGLGSTDTLTSIEIIKGSNSADVMTGSNSSDTLIGSGGNDTFFASAGGDIYYGNDTLSSTDASSNADRVDYSVAVASVDNIFANLSANAVYLRNGAAVVSTDTLYSIEEIYGTTGNDTMIGRSGSVNILSGGDGNDTLTGNTDGDVLDGGNGVNLADYSARTQNLTVDLSLSSKNIFITGTTATTTNSDTLSNIQNVTTGSGNDTLTGNSSNNILTGGAGDDTFIGGAGNDTFIGGTDTTHDSGNDTANYSASITAIDADLTRGSGQVIGNATTDGTDTLYGIENIIGTAQNDTIVGDNTNNILTGGAGDDTLTGNGGADQISGGTGNDTIYGGYDGDLIDGGSGALEKNSINYSGFAADATINLNTAKAYLNATPSLYDSVTNIQNVIAGTGNDILIGKSGVVNTLQGGAGDDTLSGNLDGDFLDGQTHTSGDTADYSAYTATTNITVDMGAQTIAQSGSATAKDSFSNIETIKTGAGADTFSVNTALDASAYTLDGGAGTDIIDYSAISEAINVTLNSTTYATVTVGASGGGNDEVIKNIEDVSGSKANDTIIGDLLANKIYGNEGNDTLDGGAGSDLVYGGDGNDFIIGTKDGVADSYYGGNASTDTGTADKIDYTAVTSNMTLTSGTTVTDSTNSIGTDTLNGIEIFDSGSGNDTLSGGTVGMTIYGNLGADKITGSSGNDILYGDNITNSHGAGDGHNTLAGGAGIDILYAGDAGDTLRGDAGNDTMVGGAGVDSLDYATNNIAITALLNMGMVSGDGLDVVDTTTIEILRSGTGADTITGADTGILKTIYTGGGNDIINGGTLGETLYGEAGNDTLRGGGGVDTLYGGTGNDVVYGAIDGDTLYGDNGTGNVLGTSDTLDFSDIATNLVVNMSTQSTTGGTVNTNASIFFEFENITGGSGDDQITGDANANILKGAAGNDTFFVSNGADTIDGGLGIDTMDFSSRNSSVNVNLATLQIINNGNGETQSLQNIENLSGGNAGDTLYGDSLVNTIFGNLGADQIFGNDGNDVLYGDNVGNTHTTADGHNTLDGGVGNDTLYAGDSGDTLIGSAGNDTLYGGAGADVLQGGAGDDTLDGGGGIDIADYRNATAKVVITADIVDPTNLTTGTSSGTEGTDIITNTVEVVYGSSGYGDTMIGNANANTFYGWGGNDTLSGGLGNDTIYGGAGDDTIAGNGGNDTLVGGDVIGTLAGWDTVDYSADSAGVTVNLTAGTAIDGLGGTDTLSGFSRVLGSNFNDTLTGSAIADELRGSGGDDWFVMTAGNDTIYGGTTSQTNGDTVDFINASTAGVVVNLATSSASGADIGTDALYEIENISGSNFNDTITGDSNNNTLVGRALGDTILAGAGADIIYGDDNLLNGNFDGSQTGNDFLYGQDGNDTLYGGLGNDSLWGGNNDDTLYGGTGDDYLNGESGINTLYGNEGNDTFELNVTTATNTITGGNGTDTLNFYNAGAITIDLALTSAQATGGGGSVTLLDSIENISGSNSGADIIAGNASNNTILGNAGNDSLFGAAGDDSIDGGVGNDTLAGGVGADIITGGTGDDVLRGGGSAYNSANTADGSADTLYGNAGNDVLYGMLDGDTLYGGDNATTFNGNDRIDYSELGAGAVYIDINATAGLSFAQLVGTPATIDTIYGFNTVYGSSGNDTIVGNINDNSINSGSGDDVIYMSPLATISSSASAGSDTIDMGIGDDKLYVFASELTSTDTINGNTGNDTILFRDGGILNNASAFANVSSIEVVQFADVANTISLDTTQLNGVQLIGGSSDDIFNYAITNFNSLDKIDGAVGNDTLSFTTAGTLTDSMLSSVSSIEKIQLANGINTVTVDVSSVSGGVATLYAGTSGTNTYNYSLANLTSADHIVGGGASTTDIVQFLNAGTIADDTRFSGLSFIDQIRLANGTNTFNIGSNETQLSGVSLIGGSGIDTFVYTSTALTDATANAKLAGSGSNDILQITGSTNVVNANLSGFTGINTLNLNSYTGTIALGANATTMGLLNIDASGNAGILTIDASGMNSAVTINATNANGSTYKGSAVAGDVLNINNALTNQDASNITGIETINVNANTTFTGDITGVSNLSVASSKTLNLDASALSGDTMSIADAGTLVINNASSSTLLNGLTLTGAGALQVNGTSSNDTITLNSTLTSYTGTITLSGGAGDDMIVGSGKNDTLLGGTGADTLTGSAGTDRMDGGEDGDVYRFTAAADIAADVINDTGSSGNDLIFMDASGNFSLASVSVNGVEELKFYQGVGSQTLTISQAQATSLATFTGFAGATDTLSVTGVTTSLNMNNAKTYTNIAKVSIDASSASSAVTLTGVSTLSNSITGGSGNDTIIAGTLADTLAGGSGNDTFQINSGYLTSADTISDASGSDTLEITDAGATISDAQLTNVTNVEILKLGAGSTVTLGTEANNAGSGFTTVNVSAGGTNTINNSTINNLSVVGGAGADTLNVSGGVAINASNLSNVENLNITSGTSAMSGTLSSATITTISSGATLTTAVPSTALSGKTINVNGTLSATSVNGTDVSHVSVNSGGTANFTLSAGGTFDASVMSKDTNGLLKIYGNTGNETITIDSAKFTNASDLISDSSGTSDTLVVTGSNAIDFTKISGMEIVDLTNYNGTTLTTNTTTSETIKIDSAYTSINAGGGVDQLSITANSVDLSGATLSNIESYAVASGATLTIKASDVTGKAVTGAGNIVVIHSADSAYNFSAITTSGAKTLEFTANSTFSGNLGSLSTVSVDNGVTATISAASLNGKTATISGAGALDITADATAANNNFSGLTNAITGNVTLNVASTLDLSAVTLGTVLDKLNTSALVTLSGAQANAINQYSGTGNITVEVGTVANVDLSIKTLAGYSGTFTVNDGTGVQTLTGTLNDDVYNVDNASTTIFASFGNDTINILSSLNSNLSGGIDGGGGGGDVLNINKSGLTFNMSNITSIETINVNQNATFNNGVLSATTTTVASGVTLSADASVLSGNTLNGSGTLSVTNLDAALTADFSHVAGATTLNVDWSGTGTYTGNLSNVDTLNISSGTMHTTDDIVSGHTITGTGSLIVDVDSNLGFTWSNMAASLSSETINFTSGTTYTQTLTNVDAITLESGVNVDISGATIGATTTSVAGAGGNESLTLNSSFLHVTSSVDLAGGSSDTLSVTGNTALTAADFGKIHNVETLDLSGYTGSVDLTSTSGITQLNTGAGVNSTTIDYAMNVNDSAGVDTLYTTASMNLSSNTLSGIETLSVASGTTTTLDYNDLGAGKITTLSGSGSVAVNGEASMNIHSENVAGLGSDKLGITGTAGADNLVLDFSQLDKIHFDGTTGTDTVSFTSSAVASGATFDTNAFSNIETLDISSLGLSGSGVTIDANALKSFTGGTNDLTLVISATASQDSYIHLSNETTYQSVTSLTAGDHVLDNGLTLHVQTV
ncbi:beta strand repeat-containing protein [Sulfurospirillum oryzae]|uniref:beta strand repeat-containing protein n=1 Tax=Sulfurospirillum oryzae TaxID=2976535 RepID=UPI0021E704DF|nr:calcium-binding protein [Sulfurospirillum oryzae]